MGRVEDATGLLQANARIDTMLEIQIPRWYETFVEEIDLVRGARDNIVYGARISDANLAAAREIAEKIVQAGEAALAR